jgi:hypothetical protein
MATSIKANLSFCWNYACAPNQSSASLMIWSSRPSSRYCSKTADNIDAGETKWLKNLFMSDGKIDEREKKFLHSLKESGSGHSG